MVDRPFLLIVSCTAIIQAAMMLGLIRWSPTEKIMTTG